MSIKKHLVLSAFCLMLLAACGTNNKNTAAVVNGTKISQKTYQATLDNLIVQQKQSNPNFTETEQTRLLLGRIVLEKLIANEVLAQEAAKAHLSVNEKDVEKNIQNLRQLLAANANGQSLSAKEIDKKFQEKLKTDGITLQQLKDNIRKELRVQLFLKDLSAKQKVELQEDDLRRFYNNTMAIVSNNEQAVQALSAEELALLIPFASQVKKLTAPRAAVSAVFLATKDIGSEELAKKQNLSKKITQELKDKKLTFVEAIQQYSDDKNALRTNGEQTILQGSLPSDLDKKVFEAPLGKVLGPLTQQDGIYILRVNEKRAETTLAYMQLRNDIIKYLAEAQIKQKIQQHTKELVSKADIKILLPQYQIEPGSQTK